jgi:hypothetical protein
MRQTLWCCTMCLGSLVAANSVPKCDPDVGSIVTYARLLLKAQLANNEGLY